jgi:FMN-dependent NADH-azoreductase
MDHQETFLTNFFGFIGINDAAFVRAEGLSSGPEQRKLALETALADVSALKAA